jgi:hypothetical protein
MEVSAMQDHPTPPGAGSGAAGPTLDDLLREFPAWEFWEGIAGLVYARKPLTSPPVVLRGEDPADLRDQIRGWLGRQP